MTTVKRTYEKPTVGKSTALLHKVAAVATTGGVLPPLE